MGRHGGGSRGGGSRGGGSRGRSSRGSGGSGVRFSNVAFRGSYDRSYYNRHGRRVSLYTSDYSYGLKPPSLVLPIVTTLIFGPVIFLVLVGFLSEIFWGEKVNGDIARIYIDDSIGYLSERDEASIMRTLEAVYETSGMPITVCVRDMSWRDYYYSIEVYSEDLYYSMGMDEDAMIILFTTDGNPEFEDWEYDIYCGDETEKCLSDRDFYRLVDYMQQGLYGSGLAGAITASWEKILPTMLSTQIDEDMVSFIITICVMLIIPPLIGGGGRAYKREQRVYEYYQEHPASQITM